MTIWQEITASALVGSERKPWHSAPDDGSTLGALLGKLSGEPAERLLKAAAVAGLHHRAGQLPGKRVRNLPDPCPQDSRPRCGSRAGWHLRSMLAGSYGAILPEWLAALMAAGQRVPEELVPDLLKSAAQQHGDLVIAAIGPLSSWLEMPVPQWRPPPDPASVEWDSGTLDERVALLERLRETDPPSAIERIRSTWSVDKADQRSLFLHTLRRNLSPRDEPFLETVLDDKSIVVRRAAVDLLARMPGSALVERVADLVRNRVTLGRVGISRTRTIQVTLFPELPVTLVRDGVEKKGAPQGTGEKAWWTQQAIALVPPSFWCQWLGLSAEELVEAASKGDDGKLLALAWTSATFRHADAVWARSLLMVALGISETYLRMLFQILTPADREAVALSSRENVLLYINSCRHFWSLAFTRGLAVHAADWPVPAMRELGQFASIDYLDEIPADAPVGLLELGAVLRFRREMYQAIHDR